MTALQTLHLDRYASATQPAWRWLEAQRYLPRLWDSDASLWSADPAVQTAIRNRLGWLRFPRQMARQVDALRRFSQEIQSAGLTQALLLGMGGSGLFPEVCRHVFGVAASHTDVTVLDTTDPTAILAQRQRCPARQLLAIVSSKSGTTSEITALSKYFYDVLSSAAPQPGDHAIAITDAGTPLEEQASTWKFRRVFAHGPDSGADVGGRFSALTYFGLVPAALLGVDVELLLARALEMLDRCGPSVPLQDNPAAQLGVVLGAMAGAGRTKMTLLCAPQLLSVGTWVEQLVAESTGKAGKGITPCCGEALAASMACASERVFIELQLASEPDRALEAHVHGLIDAGHPVIRIRWQDRYDLGGEVVKWSIATAIAGSLLGVNPFDEPNVQESKSRTNALLAHFTHHGRFPSEEPPRCSDATMAVYGAVPSSASSVSQYLSAFFKTLRPSDYIALLSFLPRTDGLDRAIAELRMRLARGANRATLVGIGPRYLHSTGQLFKGGPDGGVFLLLTADDPVDAPIPGERYSFRVLKQAQALGDFQAMQQRNRRVLRVHLSGDLDRAMPRLLSALDEALASSSARH